MKQLFKLHHKQQAKKLLLLLLHLNQLKVLLVKQLLNLKKNFHQKLLLKFRKVPIFQQNQHQLKHQLVLKLLLLQQQQQNQLQQLNQNQHLHQNQHQHLHLNLLNQLLVKLRQVKNQQHQPLLKRNQLGLLL
jgi:hypothetical protein